LAHVLTVTIGVVVALTAMVLPNGSSHAATDDASIDNWTSGMCNGVVHWLETLGTPPAPDPNGDQLLAVRRAVGDVISDGYGLMLHSVKVMPPVPNGKKVGARLRRALTAAVDEAQRASDLLAGPTGSSPDTLAAAQRHLEQGHDLVVATMRRLRGHSGNARLDQAVKDQCGFITSLRPIGSSGTA
jgi:hypothetical protein